MQIQLTETDQDLRDILDLQKQNLVGNLPADVQAREGFVTLQYTLTELQQLHAAAPSIIARADGRLVGYALVAVPSVRGLVPPLDELFTMAETLPYRGRPIADYSYYLMGQICVADGYRGLGLFDKLYQAHRVFYSSHYQLLVTDIAARNARSLRAHERVGFQPLHHFLNQATQQEWVVVGWDWQLDK
ncbi:GNAT family N-acetyltransferase [Hymenobacter sp. YC55]|uniref:GNAT family N-acetyltransferase n=1 Tax=Hymenobacter sp. YC55 TaxID=3034019 RepID=UPI0023F744F4|nr:GNAT family N-acetyltransferase [Hymenobacter sp. YC55]MDF7814722.1 GNAT family N-acetyltransferase [Hymenobacter sp. YC55]